MKNSPGWCLNGRQHPFCNTNKASILPSDWFCCSGWVTFHTSSFPPWGRGAATWFFLCVMTTLIWKHVKCQILKRWKWRVWCPSSAKWGAGTRGGLLCTSSSQKSYGPESYAIRSQGLLSPWGRPTNGFWIKGEASPFLLKCQCLLML